MSSFIFLYNGTEIHIQGEKNEIMNKIIQKFCTKAKANINNLYFLSNGKIIDGQISEDKIQMNEKAKNILL